MMAVHYQKILNRKQMNRHYTFIFAFTCHGKGLAEIILRVGQPKKPREFIKELREFPYLTKQLETTGLISYLYASDGKLIVDQKTPPKRFGGEVKDDAKLWGASIAKSMTSYLMGHAICQGYIEGVEHQLTDWPLLKGLCLTTPIKLYRPDLSAKIAIDLLILLNTVIEGDPYSKEVQLVPSKAMHASAPKLTCLIK